MRIFFQGYVKGYPGGS